MKARKGVRRFGALRDGSRRVGVSLSSLIQAKALFSSDEGEEDLKKDRV